MYSSCPIPGEVMRVKPWTRFTRCTKHFNFINPSSSNDNYIFMLWCTAAIISHLQWCFGSHGVYCWCNVKSWFGFFAIVMKNKKKKDFSPNELVKWDHLHAISWTRVKYYWWHPILRTEIVGPHRPQGSPPWSATVKTGQRVMRALQLPQTQKRSYLEIDDTEIRFYYERKWCVMNLPYVFIQKLAKKFKKYSKIVITKIDAFINDLPPAYRTDIFPTIFFATM